jgi:hypothetical protein
MTISQHFSPQVVLVSTDSTDSLNIGSTHSQQRTRKHAKSSSSSARCSSATKSTKAVRFAAHESFSTTTLIECADDFSNETRRELWWTPQELKSHSDERKAFVKKFVADQDQKQQDDDGQNDSVDKKVAALYKQCSSFNVSQLLRYKANKQFVVDMASVRGLEAKLSRSIRQHRKQHVQTILSLVEKQHLQEDSRSGEFLLAAISADSSRKSQILARVLAQVDAKACK